GLTGWLGKTYAELGDPIVGGPFGMLEGFQATMRALRGDESHVWTVVVSEEAATYRPEMQWLGQQIGFNVLRPEELTAFTPNLTLYRFFELFDIPNVPNARALMDAAARGDVHVTPPFKPQLEEKMLFAFLWMEQLHAFWREQLGDKTLAALREVLPYTWILDPMPLPPHAVIPELGIHDWRDMAKF